MLKVYGTNWDPEWIRAKKYLGEHNISYTWVDIEKVQDAKRKAQEVSGSSEIPVVVFDDGSFLVEPTNEQLKEKLNLTESDKCEYHDLAIIGGGPSGLAAATYTTREGMDTVVFEKKAFGGQAAITDIIDNYPGFPNGVKGMDLASDLKKQAERFGTKLDMGVEVTKVEDEKTYKKLFLSDNSCHYAKAVLLTTGTDYRRLGVPGEEENIGRGVHFCATCDGPFYKDKELIIVGGGNSAMQEGLFLSKLVKKLTFIVLGKELTGEEILKNKVKKLSNAEFHFSLETFKLEKVGEGLQGKMKVHTKSVGGDERVVFGADGVFVFIGLIPNSKVAKDSGIEVDERGFIKTDKTLETNMKGVFAAGDCRSGATLQIASAVGEGATAALMIREYLKEN